MWTTGTVTINDECGCENEDCGHAGEYEFKASYSRYAVATREHPAEGGIEDVHSFTKDGVPVKDTPDWLIEAAKATVEDLGTTDEYDPSDDVDDCPDYD